MEINHAIPVRSLASSPTPSMTPSPTPLEKPADGAAIGLFRGLGKETLRTRKIPIRPGDTRILLESASNEDYLPGQPRIRLAPESGASGPLKDKDKVLEYLRKSHLTTKLDELMPYMKYIFVSLLARPVRVRPRCFRRG